MKKKKILHVPFGGIFNGGVASVVLSIVGTLNEEYEFGSMVFREKGTREHVFEKYGRLHRVDCYFRKTPWGKFWEHLTRPFRLCLATYSICRKYHYDILHAHNGYDMVFCLIGARIAGVPQIIAHSHNSASPEKARLARRIIEPIQRHFINLLATDRVGCSQKACDDFFRHPLCTPIPNAIDLRRFVWKRNPHQGLNIVHVGRYDYPKNQSFIIDIAHVLKDYQPALRVNLVGFGKDEKMLKEKVEKYSMEDIAIFSDGKKTDVYEAYADADIMIFPSCYEGFGIALIEAQSTGCYVFASDVVPTETNVGAMSCLSLNESAEIWAKKILDYWNAERRPVKEVVEKQMARFDEKVIAEQYRKLYD